MLLLSSVDFSKSFFSKTKIRNTIRVSNRLDPVRTDVMSVLICVQTACKDYWQTTKVVTSTEKVKLR